MDKQVSSSLSVRSSGPTTAVDIDTLTCNYLTPDMRVLSTLRAAWGIRTANDNSSTLACLLLAPCTTATTMPLRNLSRCRVELDAWEGVMLPVRGCHASGPSFIHHSCPTKFLLIGCIPAALHVISLPMINNEDIRIPTGTFVCGVGMNGNTGWSCCEGIWDGW